MKKTNCILVIVFILMIILPCTGLYACPFPCCPGHLTSAQCTVLGCAPCTPVPLDGGLSALLVAGLAYGSKKIFGKSKS